MPRRCPAPTNAKGVCFLERMKNPIGFGRRPKNPRGIFQDLPGKPRKRKVKIHFDSAVSENNESAGQGWSAIAQNCARLRAQYSFDFR